MLGITSIIPAVVKKTSADGKGRFFNRSATNSSRRPDVAELSPAQILADAEPEELDIEALKRSETSHKRYADTYKRFWGNVAHNWGKSGKEEDFDLGALVLVSKILAQWPKIGRSRHIYFCHIKGHLERANVWLDRDWGKKYSELADILHNLCEKAEKDVGWRLDDILKAVKSLDRPPRDLETEFPAKTKPAPSKQPAAPPGDVLSTKGFKRLGDVVIASQGDWSLSMEDVLRCWIVAWFYFLRPQEWEYSSFEVLDLPDGSGGQYSRWAPTDWCWASRPREPRRMVPGGVRPNNPSPPSDRRRPSHGRRHGWQPYFKTGAAHQAGKV